MNCPICHKIIKHDKFCAHDIAPSYTVWYDNNYGYIDGLTTEVYGPINNHDYPERGKLLMLKGFVFINKERIEKLLLLQGK